MHVAGLLALGPLQALSNAVRLFHHTGVHWVLNPALHAAILHASIAWGRALAIDASFVDVRECLPWVRSDNNRGSGVHRISVLIQAHELSMDQYLEREKIFSMSKVVLNKSEIFSIIKGSGYCESLFCSHPADAVHTDVRAAHVASGPIHHCRFVSVEEVLSSWDTVQLTRIGCYRTDTAIKNM